MTKAIGLPSTYYRYYNKSTAKKLNDVFKAVGKVVYSEDIYNIFNCTTQKTSNLITRFIQLGIIQSPKTHKNTTYDKERIQQYRIIGTIEQIDDIFFYAPDELLNRITKSEVIDGANLCDPDKIYCAMAENNFFIIRNPFDDDKKNQGWLNNRKYHDFIMGTYNPDTNQIINVSKQSTTTFNDELTNAKIYSISKKETKILMGLLNITRTLHDLGYTEKHFNNYKFSK